MPALLTAQDLEADGITVEAAESALPSGGSPTTSPIVAGAMLKVAAEARLATEEDDVLRRLEALAFGG